jgi:uncharacterized protein (DUF1501 family)
MSVSRRQFVRMSCCSAAAAAFVSGVGNFGLINAFAQGVSDYKALVCIFLFGGNDGNNMLMPFDTTGFQSYTSVRGGLALAQNAVLPISTATGNTPFALHPQLGPWQQLFNSKQLALLANVGTLVAPITRTEYQKRQKAVPQNLFSHYDQQREWQTSIPYDNATSGWAGRISDKLSGMNAPSTFPTITSVAGNNIMNVGVNTRPVTINPGQTFGFSRFDTSAVSQARKTSAQELLTLDSGVTLVQAASTPASDVWKNSKLLGDALAGAAALQTVFPTTNIGRQLQQVAKLLQVRDALSMKRQIFFCSLGGFDTHSNQLADQDNLFSQLAPAMRAFYDANVELGIAPSVTAFTLSDFGRTLAPASGGGSDHAWGNHHVIMGGAVKGGEVYGAYPTIALGGPDDVGSEGRWIPTTSLDQYAATLGSWFGVSDTDLPGIFPNLTKFAAPKLNFL